MNMDYRGFEVELSEGKTMDYKGATFTSENGLVFRAESKVGVSMANDPEVALKGAQKQIDDYLGN
jgi:hypothetical protein